MTPRLACIAVTLALLGCPKAPPGGSSAVGGGPESEPPLSARVSDIRDIVKAQDEAVWNSWTQGAALDLKQTYVGYSALFTLASVRQVRAEAEAVSDPREARAASHVAMYLVGEHLSQQLAEHTDAIASLEASLSFPVADKDVLYRDLNRQLANEKSPSRRAALYSAATPAIERLNQSLRRKDERLAGLIVELGYPSYQACAAQLRQLDPGQLEALAERVLSLTQDLYVKVMGQLARKEMSSTLAQLRRFDLPRLFRPSGADDLFPREALLPRAEFTLRGLGIQLKNLPNLKVDAADRPRKNARALSLAVRVPRDIRLSLRPSGGARDQGELFHELGHALHYAYSTERRFELNKLGNVAVSEAYAFLLEDLLEDPAWLTEHAGLTGERLKHHLFAASAHRLFLLRKAAGSLLYDLSRHRADPAETKALYASLMTRALAIAPTPHDDARFLVEAEDLLQSADDFRAWILAAQLQAQLRSRFGAQWWTRADAGSYLASLWASANGKSAEEIAVAAGDSALDPEPLVQRLNRGLNPGGSDGGDWRPRPIQVPQTVVGPADGGVK